MDVGAGVEANGSFARTLQGNGSQTQTGHPVQHALCVHLPHGCSGSYLKTKTVFFFFLRSLRRKKGPSPQTRPDNAGHLTPFSCHLTPFSCVNARALTNEQPLWQPSVEHKPGASFTLANEQIPVPLEKPLGQTLGTHRSMGDLIYSQHEVLHQRVL